MQKFVAGIVTTLFVAGQIYSPALASAQADFRQTATPIKHLVVIFQENVSFDHYFGTYPNAKNPPNEPRFVPKFGTPQVNGLSNGLLFSNPNFLNTALNGTGAANPFRLDRTQAATADQDHDYGPEQQAFHGGLMDGFPKFTGTPGPPPSGLTTNGLVMGVLRRQHGYGLLELCAAVCDERQLVRHELWTVDAGRDQCDLRSDGRRR